MLNGPLCVLKILNKREKVSTENTNRLKFMSKLILDIKNEYLSNNF